MADYGFAAEVDATLGLTRGTWTDERLLRSMAKRAKRENFCEATLVRRYRIQHAALVDDLTRVMT